MSIDTYKIAKCVRGCATDEQFQELITNIEHAIEATRVSTLLEAATLAEDWSPFVKEKWHNGEITEAEFDANHGAARTIGHKIRNLIVKMPPWPMEPASEPEHGSARNRPSGSVPVAGGGARERARRLARMEQSITSEPK